MDLPRASGILLHLTSLPGRFGIGDLGPAADWFLDVLVETGQRWWQMLPVGPAGAGDSPYASPSSFAGNPMLISPELLAEQGLLTPEELADVPELPADRVDFAAVGAAKGRLLRLAASRFRPDDGFDAFRHRAADWLDDYCRYNALKRRFGGLPWSEWDRELADRVPDALRRCDRELADEIAFVRFEQYMFERQWESFRDRCRARGIGLIGDLPIFVAFDGADAWAHRDLFRLDANGRPSHTAGVPPDYFNELGQDWGNPLYRWDSHLKDEFAWWSRRVSTALERFDLLRFDHFRGLEACYSIPVEAENAADSRCGWEPSPGHALLSAVRRALGGRLPLIAEDLGVITPGVEALRDDFGLPGMRVLQFAFGNDPLADAYLPHAYIRNCVAYTGTHDNDTTLGWFTCPPGSTTQPIEEIEAERSFVRRYLGPGWSDDVPRGFVRLAWGSVADTAIAPLQDVLGLGSEARMNTPGVGEGNWGWRFRADAFTPEIRSWLAELTAVFNRWNGPIPQAYRTRLGSSGVEAPGAHASGDDPRSQAPAPAARTPDPGSGR
ncbi:4-alpha-glucanotransferase [Tautonia sociabilis]|uniref:4-alpha-glucanotransferase n=1 Tax=Tautonia sociabilis TaxID=2080755 RepID=A0A432MI34_9BACT|nr:4-alpha-glucanotransferase [Tautonia sociabilis]RUL86866.1 4-alpha-glucanotransferase [Tautonia sociabilis]